MQLRKTSLLLLVPVAVLAVGALHGDWRNALKDYNKGLAYLRELLADFPDTQHRQRATEMMAAYEKALEKR